MICIKDGYPLIYGADGKVAQFSQAWLHAILQDAARSVECEGWPLVEDVAAAVSAYLRRHHFHPVISLEEFERMMRHTLNSIGYPEMAGVIQMAHPVRQMSLLHGLHDPPLQNEADFYARLQKTIHHCHRQGVQRLDLSDLSACEDILRSINQAFPWYEPSGARVKIITFVRRQIARLSWPQHLQCSIS